jgi:uncharacterized protein (TIGR03435 family)
MMTSRACIASVLVAAAIVLCAQSPRPVFEAASIKPSSPSSDMSYMGTAGRFVATGATLRVFVKFAYRSETGRTFLDSQVFGLPRWGETDRFDVQAKAARVVPVLELALMLQSMLEDRLQLKIHREERELPVYSLALTKGGVKMKPSADQTPLPADDGLPRRFDPNSTLRGGVRMVGKPSPSGAITLSIKGTALPISRLINVLQQYVDRPILDRTGLSALYDLELEFALPQTQAASLDEQVGASLFTAVQEQLGLTLDAGKKPVEVLVVDHAEHPTPD